MSAAPGGSEEQARPSGLTFLQEVACRDLAVVQAASERPGTPPEHSGFNALHVAALVEFPEAVRPLVDAGASPSCRLRPRSGAQLRMAWLGMPCAVASS